MKGRRKRMFINKLENENGDWIQGEETIAREACDYYGKIFTGKNERINEANLQCTTKKITDDQNKELDKMPTVEELSKVVVQMNPNSARGPYGIGASLL